MWRQTAKAFLLTLLAVLAIGVPLLSSLRQHPPSPPATGEKQQPPSPAESFLSSQAPLYIGARQEMTRAGWLPEAADKVLRLNAGWFDMLHEVDPLAYRKQLTLLAGLGNDPGLMFFLEEHPESAALFTLVDQPSQLLRLFESSPDEYEFLCTLYLLHANPMDAELLTEALQNHADLIARLYRRGLVGSEAIFLFKRGDEGSREYDQWLREIILVKLDKPDHELASLLNLIFKYGPEIRLRLRTNEAFRLAFRATIWPRLVRVAAENHNMFELYLDEPRIWDLLALPEGEELLRLRGPLLPIDLLYGYPQLGRSPYPPALHQVVIQTLLKGDSDTFKALMKFRDDPLFHELAGRDIPPSVKAALFKKLFAAGDEYHELLRRYSRMSDRTLRSEAGPPPGILKIWTPFYFTLWEVPKKLSQGRTPTSSEWINSLADPLSLFYPVLKIGVAIVNVGETASGSKEDATSGPSLKEAGMQVAEQQLGRELAAQLSDQELLPFGVTGMLTRMQTAYRKTVSDSTIIESTGPVRFMLGYSGTSHRSLTALQLVDGRLLLRGDGRLVIHPGNDVPQRETSGYLKASASRFVDDSLGGAEQESRTNWQQNLSAWWLIQASGMLRQPKGDPQPRS